MNGAKKAVANGLRQLGQVHVVKLCPPLVNAFSQIRIILVGRAEQDGLGPGQRAVERMAGGRAGDDANPEWLARGMGLHGTGRDGFGNFLGSASGREAAKSDSLAVLNQGGDLGGGKPRECIICHKSISFKCRT